MLHIIGLILKIIGILLLVILGIIVVLLCTILFVPIKYDVKAAFPGKVEELSADGKVTWLLHLIRADISYKEKELKWKVRAAWFKFGSDVEEKPVKEETKKAEPPKVEEPKPESPKVEKPKAEPPKQKPPKQEPPKQEPSKTKNIKDDSPKVEAKKENVFVTIKKKVQDIFEQIKCTFQKICDKIREGIEIKDKILSFLEEKTHKAAFSKVIKELVWIKRMIRIKGGHIHLRFGFEDPSLTGKVLAGLSVLYPFLGDNMNIQPEFEEVCMEGDVHLKGHIRLIHLIMMALKLLLDKNVRKTFKDAMELKDQLI